MVQSYGQRQPQRTRQQGDQATAILHLPARLLQLVLKLHCATLPAASSVVVIAHDGVMSQTQKLSESSHRLTTSADIMDIARSTDDGRSAGRGTDPVSVRNIARASTGGGHTPTQAATRILTQHPIDGGIALHGQGRAVARLRRPRAREQAA